MNKRRFIPGVLVFVMLLISGCSGISQAADSAVNVDFDKKEDLSLYFAEQDKQPEKEPVPLDGSLEYVDTNYMIRLLGGESVTSEARKTYEEFMPEWDFVLIDARPANVFAEGHINGAINVPDAEFDGKAGLLPENKETVLIFYCGGLDCPLSANSAKKAMDMGYKNVKVYQEGIPFWKQSANYLVVTEEYVKAKIMETNMAREDKKPVIILDARPYSAYFEAHIPNAAFVDADQYGAKFAGVQPSDKSTEIIVYCGGFMCGKSHSVASSLVTDGYTNVKVFAGGIPLWKANGLPTFGTAGKIGDFNVAEGKVDRGLTPAQFDERLKEENVTVLDVRTDTERSNGAIKGSIHIPDSQIHADPKAIAGKLPDDKEAVILIHCASGVRAGGVVDKIADLGYPNTFYLNNAIKIGPDGSYTFN
ncbi:rhodanese-like domain-containing protein [Bacillus marinisedimentorum]|uniref:rhodanese-like domain-containing protein n=1 Tax=Bacillus marinisedimentorum TaxID=1821260 RepID=UPI000872E9BF|nr:rhodanese-like domain-containing protein [Bacillus marinisedimentorum]